jgi:hypothetical protein
MIPIRGTSPLRTITETVYAIFTADAVGARGPAPLAALARVCRVRTGGRAGAHAPRIHCGAPSGRPMMGACDPVRRCVTRPVEKCYKVGDQRTQRRRHCQRIMRARERRAGARSWPVLSAAHQACDHWVNSGLTRRRQQMRRVNSHRTEAALVSNAQSRLRSRRPRNLSAEIMQGRSGPGSSPWSMPPQSLSQTSPSRPHTHRPPQGRAAASANRRSGRHGCRST